MTSYEIGSNSSRYPYDYSFVTDGTNSEYTDTTETSFILPTITGADADKFLQVNAQATGYEYTAVDAELPPQAGQAGKFLETNGSSVFWDTVNQVPTPSATGQILNSTGAGTYSFSDNPTIDIIRTGSGSSSGLRIGTSNTGLYGLSSTNVMGIITGNIARQTWDSNGSTISVPLTLSNGLSFTFTSQATSRTLSQTDTVFHRINYTSNNVTYTLAPLANGTQFWFNPFATGGTFTCTLTTSNTSTGMETYYDGVRSTIPITGSGTIPPAVNITMGYIYQCVYFTNVTSWLIIRHGTDKNGVVGNLTITSNLFVQGTGINSIAGQLNLTTAGSAAAPTLLFGDSTVPQSGIWGTDDNIFFGTQGVQRFSISNVSTSITGNLIMSTPAVGITGANGGIGVVANIGATAGVYNTASTNSGIRFENFNDRTLIYARGLNVLTCERSGVLTGDEGIVNTEEAFVMKKAMRTPIMDRTGNFTVSISTPIVNRILVQPSSNITITLPHLTQSWISGQQHVFIPYRDTNSGATAQVFLGTGQTAGATGIQLHIMHNNTRTVVTANNTYEIIEGGVYTCIYHHLTPSTCIWYIWIDGLLPPIAPQVVKKTFVIGATSSAAYVYDSGNTAPATTLISNSIQSTKNITLGNMGASYDGFEFEFMLTGDLNNFGVAVTLSLAGSFVKVRSGAIGVDGSTANQVHTFSRPMNEFRITGVFVWNGGTNPYWVVVDRGVYKQRATNTKITGGTYTVDRNTPEDVLLTRATATTIDFKNLVTFNGSQEDYDGFNFWLSFTNATSTAVSFTNSTSVSLMIIGNSGVQTITAGSTASVVAAGQTSTCLRCVFRDTAPGGFGWYVYAG